MNECVFCGFISGRLKENKNGLPFVKLHEREHTLAFLSTDTPATVDGHFLVIPKAHYEKLEDIPGEILTGLIEHVQFIVIILGQDFPGCNVLLNNGSDAGQHVFHTHFHIVPRRKNDGISIEVWDTKNMSEDEFLHINEHYKRVIDKMEKVEQGE